MWGNRSILKNVVLHVWIQEGWAGPHPKVTYICQIGGGEWPRIKNMIKPQGLIGILSCVQPTLKKMVHLNL